MKLVDIKDNLTQMFQDVVDLAGKHYDKSDKAQLCISHGQLKEEVFIHLQDLRNLSGESIMERIEKVLNSNESVVIDDSLQIHVGLMRLTKGGGPTARSSRSLAPARTPTTGNHEGKAAKKSGRTLPLFPHLNNTPYCSIFNKKAIVEIVCEEGEFLCAAKSIVVCMAKLDGMRRYEYIDLIKKSRQSRRGRKSLRTRAENLQKRTGLPLDAPVRIDQLANFEQALNVKIVVIQFLEERIKPCITQCSDREDSRIIYLYYTNNHFHAVVNSNAMFPKELICTKCFETYSPNTKDHPCLPSHCFVCRRGQCEKFDEVRCSDCNLVCRSQSCFDSHKQVNNRYNTSLCETRHKCQKCHKIINLKKQTLADHRCGQYRCRCCGEFVDHDHLCYLRRKDPKGTSGKFLLFDVETMQDRIFECDEGYTPPTANCSGCSSERQCNKCKKCTKCRKSNCGRHMHQVNLVVSQTMCDLCKEKPLIRGARCKSCGDLCFNCQRASDNEDDSFECTDPECGVREKVFSGYDAMYKFCSFLISPRYKSFHCLAHNGRGFDFSFVLDYCLSEAGIKPECVYAGSKLMTLKIGDGLDIRFIDSLSFMGMALKKLPKAFGLRPESEMSGDVEELRKGDFPHKMNTRENQNYRGAFPPLDMYGVESMNPDEKEKFVEWHAKQEGKIFDLQEEMLAYCRLDVTILRLACARFRQIFMEITTVSDDDGSVLGYVDPFAHITIASACMQVFRVNYIEEYHDITTLDQGQGRATFKSGKWWLNGERVDHDRILSSKFVSSNIAQVPSQGYVRNSNHSSISIAWLEWESVKLGREIRHARNRGEKVIVCGGKRYAVDGFDEQNGVIYEFHGCRYHACTSCFPNQKLRDSRSGFTMGDIHKMTVNRTRELREAGYRVIEIYECQFLKLIKQNPRLKKFVDELDIPHRMKVRDCFYGGRTSVFTMYHECVDNEQIHYADVCSLYPAINKHSRMPVGHPEIITRDFDKSLENYFGIVHCKILPPRSEYCPVLPVRMGGKLTFPLCKTCATNEHHGDCKHSDQERLITGAWCTPELITALEQGYKIDKIYEVYHYPDSAQYDPESKSGGLFSEQVDTFIKIKTEASGWPDWVSTEEDKNKYLAQVEEKVGVVLDREQITKNPALRSIAKICLNSFWGKWGQRSNMSQVKFLTSTVELEKLQNNSQRILNRFHVVNEDILAVEYQNRESFESESFITNEVLAAFTTCWARLELLKHIKSVGERILYCDTDSIIFLTRKISDKDGNDYFDVYPQIGDSLGELTNELPPGVHITRFASTAPKSYSYRCSDNSEITKFKGVSLNFENSQRVNFEAIKELVFGETVSVSLIPQTQFVRGKYDGQICNAELVKTVNRTLNKRRILENFDTVPFGYVFEHRQQ